MNEFLNKANSISPLSDEAAEELMKCIRTKTYEKGALIHKEGRVCRHLFLWNPAWQNTSIITTEAIMY